MIASLILTILDFLILPWVFYILGSISVIVTYCFLNNDDHDVDFHWGAATLTALLVGLCAYRFEAFAHALASWPQGLYLIGGYILAGALVGGYKWLMILIDFRPKARKWLDAHTDYAERYPSKADALSRHVFGSGGKDRVIQSEGSFHLDHRAFPISNWITFWPLFIFSVVLDPVWRLTQRLLKWAGSLLERLSKAFSVS